MIQVRVDYRRHAAFCRHWQSFRRLAVGSFRPATDDYFSSVVFAVGAIICGAANGKLTLLIGRMLLGAAIGSFQFIISLLTGLDETLK